MLASVSISEGAASALLEDVERRMSSDAAPYPSEAARPVQEYVTSRVMQAGGAATYRHNGTVDQCATMGLLKTVIGERGGVQMLPSATQVMKHK